MELPPNFRKTDQAQQGPETKINSKPLETFALSPNLPTDVRLKIWGITLLQNEGLAPRLPEPYEFGRRKLFRLPPAFLVCADIWQEAIRHYEISTWRDLGFPRGVSSTPEDIANAWKVLVSFYEERGKLPFVINPYWYCLRAAKKHIKNALHFNAPKVEEMMRFADVWGKIEVGTLNDKILVRDIVVASTYLKELRHTELAKPTNERNPYLYRSTDGVWKLEVKDGMPTWVLH
jgi:hypothetical protein